MIEASSSIALLLKRSKFDANLYWFRRQRNHNFWIPSTKNCHCVGNVVYRKWLTQIMGWAFHFLHAVFPLSSLSNSIRATFTTIFSTYLNVHTYKSLILNMKMLAKCLLTPLKKLMSYQVSLWSYYQAKAFWRHFVHTV